MHKSCEEAGLTIFYDAGHVQLGVCVNAVATENEPAKGRQNAVQRVG